MSTPSPLRARLAALPLDRAPLRRAGLLSLLLVALLAAGKAFGPGRPAAATTLADRNEAAAPAEGVSASRPTAPGRSAWTGGRVLAVVLLAAGGGIALFLHRRRPAGTPGSAAALGVIETRPLGPNQSLQLVACADEVLLLAVGAEGTTLLRHWPRAHFDADEPTLADAVSAPPPPDAASFAEVLAVASGNAPREAETEPTPPASTPRPADRPSAVPPSVVPSPAPSPVAPVPAPPASSSAPPATDRSWGLHQFGSAHA